MVRILLALLLLLVSGGAFAADTGVSSVGSVQFNGTASGSLTLIVPAAAGSLTLQLPTVDGASGQVLTTNGAGVLSFQTVSGTGTVTSVGLTVPGSSIFGVTGSPVTISGSLGLTTTGTSGGVPYFSSGTVLSSSGALTANLPIFGGGAGAAPVSGTRSGNTTKVVTTTGTLTSGHCGQWDANSNLIDSGAACGAGGGSLTVNDGSGNTQTAVTVIALGQGLITTNGSSGTAPINLSVPDRNATSGTILATDMAGQVNATTGITFPAISGTVLASGMTTIVTAPNGTVAVTTSPAITGCASNSTIFQGGFMAVVSNGTSLDCAGFPGFGIFSGDITGTAAGVLTIGSSAVTTGKINANAVTFAKIQTSTANSLMGFDGSGNSAGVTVGSGLSLSGGTLTVTGGATGVTFTDGTHTVASATQLTVTGGTVGGTSPNATLTVTGGSGCSVSGTQFQILAVNAAGTGCTPDANGSVNAGALTLGASGTAGSVTMGNATSGTITLQPQTGALGSVTVSIPAATDTLVNLAGTQTLSNKTFVAPALGTPASATLTNATGLPATSVVAGALANGMTATTQSAKDNSTKLATTAYVDRPTGLTTGTSVTLTAPRQYFICTGVCTITVPVPAAGYEFCVIDNVAVSSVITINNPGSSTQFGKYDQSGYGTASTGTMVSDGSTVGSKVCLGGIDSTHYNVLSSSGTWTNS